MVFWSALLRYSKGLTIGRYRRTLDNVRLGLLMSGDCAAMDTLPIAKVTLAIRLLI